MLGIEKASCKLQDAFLCVWAEMGVGKDKYSAWVFNRRIQVIEVGICFECPLKTKQVAGFLVSLFFNHVFII